MKTTHSSFKVRLLMAKTDDSHCCRAAYKTSPKHLSNIIHGEKPEYMIGKFPPSCNRVRWPCNIDATEHKRMFISSKVIEWLICTDDEILVCYSSRGCETHLLLLSLSYTTYQVSSRYLMNRWTKNTKWMDFFSNLITTNAWFYIVFLSIPWNTTD